MLVLDQDQALDFYVGKLGLKVAEDVDGLMRWLAVSVPGDDGREILLERPGSPSHDDATADEIRELVAKGAGGGTLIFRTDDCQATYDALVAQGVEFTETHRAPVGSTARCATVGEPRIRITQRG